jgi:hypothetical protein
MIDGIDLWTLVERVGVPFALVVIFSMIAGRFLTYLDNQQKSDLSERQSWDKIRKDDNQQWMTLINGLKMNIESQGLAQAEFYKTVSQDRITSVAYQNTTSTALADLLTISKDLRGVPDGVRKTNETLGVINKRQLEINDLETKHDLEMRQQLEKTNSALLEMQRELKHITTAMEKLPVTMQATIAPLVGMMETVLTTAQATQARLDDLPLMPMVETDKTDYVATNGDAPDPVAPLPVHKAGE